MSEVFFSSKNEEYSASSWLVALRTMQHLGKVNGAHKDSSQRTVPASVCIQAYQEPQEFGNRLYDLSRSPATQDSTEITSYKLMGIMDRERRISQGLSDALALLVEDDLAFHVMDQKPFKRLLPLIDELSQYSIARYADPIINNQSNNVGIELAIRYTQAESDFYLSQYDSN